MNMNRVLLLGRRDVGEKNDSLLMSQLLQKGASMSTEIRHAYYDELGFVFGNRSDIFVCSLEGRENIEDYNMIIQLGWSGTRVLSDIAHTVALFGRDRGVICWNSELVSARSMTKLSQLYRAAQAGAVIPKSVFSLNHALLEQLAEESIAGAQLIYKDIEASRGRRNMLLDRAEMGVIRSEYAAYPMIVQEYIQNDHSDLRLVVMGGELGLVIRREGDEGTHLTNTSAGAVAKLLSADKLPETLRHEVLTIARHFRRELCGIDYMYDIVHQRYVFLEINMTPQLVTGSYIDDKISSLYVAISAALKNKGEHET